MSPDPSRVSTGGGPTGGEATGVGEASTPRRGFLRSATVVAAAGTAAALVPGGVSGAQSDSLVIDVRDLGARGDGLADDSGPIRRAFELAVERSATLHRDRPPDERAAGPVVLVPAGIYRCPELTDVRLDWPVVVRGTGGAVLDQARAADADRDDAVFRCAASLDVEGLELRDGGVWFDFSGPDSGGGSGGDPAGGDVPIPFVRMADCRVVRSGAPIVASASTPPVGRLVVEGITVVGGEPRANRCRGVVFASRRYGSVLVSGNRVEHVLQYGLRIGADAAADDPDPYDAQLDVVCTANSVTGVWQPEGRQDRSTNGIRIQGRRVVVSGNTLSDVANGDDDQVEGIYVKGRNVLVSGNTLLDAGRAQGQITVKASDVLVEGNRVEFVDATRGDGIRVEGADVQVRGNEVVNPPPGFQGIGCSSQADSTLVVSGNIVRSGAPERAVVTDGRRTVVIRDNTFLDLEVGAEVVGVRALDRDGDPVVVEQVVVTGNVFANCPAGAENRFCLRLVADDRSELRAAVVSGNTFVSTAAAVRTERGDEATFGRIVVHGNSYTDVPGRLSNAGAVPTALQDFGLEDL